MHGFVRHTIPFAVALAAVGGVTSIPATAADAGEAAFTARCGNCHAARDIQAWGRRRADAAARLTWLQQFLRRHYPPSESERSIIIAHIQATIAGAATTR